MIMVSSEVPFESLRESEFEADSTIFRQFSEYNMTGISLIENVNQYKYIDMGHETFMTLVIP